MSGRAVGVIGGMGPAATLAFVARVQALTPAACDQDHLRLIIDCNPNVPDRNAAVDGEGPSPRPVLAEMARGLERAGAELLVMPCNAAHAFADAVRAASALPFVDLIETASDAAFDTGARAVGVLAADGCLNAGLYQRSLAARGVEAIVPSAKAQAAFMQLLYAIKAGDCSPAARRKMRDLANGLVDRGAAALLAGCTGAIGAGSGRRRGAAGRLARNPGAPHGRRGACAGGGDAMSGLAESHARTPAGKVRARGAGVPLEGQPGAWNSITDVAGVEVGYCTLIRGEGPLVVGQGPVRTGVTAIFPHGQASPNGGAYAGYFCMSGNGEMSGAAFIEERGRFDGPITLTNTHSCGMARDATAKWLFERWQPGDKADQPFWLPVAAETHDGALNDVNGHHVRPEHVVAAFDDARSGRIEEGSVGGGTGMRCFEFKGGSGTASRVATYAGRRFTVGAFVQSNFGKRHLLRISGVPVGLELPLEEPGRSPEHGSIIVIVATDAPMLPHQLRRLARRAAYGISACGGIASNESGDLFLAFSTANREAVEQHAGMLTAEYLGEEAMSRFYEATIQAVEEAILNSMFANETMIGRDGFTVRALPIPETQAILRRYGRLDESV
jgi:aspartate racemase